MRIRRLTFAAAAALFAFGAAASGQEKLRLGTEGAYPPFNYFDPSGQVTGFDIEIGQALCAHMGVECEVVAQDWDGLIPSLQVGKFDVIMAGMFITPKRLEIIDFTQPYAVDPGGFAVAKDSELGKLGLSGEKFDMGDAASSTAAIEKLKPALKGKVVGVQAATTMLEFVKKYAFDAPDAAFDAAFSTK